MQSGFLVLLVVYWFQIGCYPPLGCTRKQRVSTYASIWPELPFFFFLKKVTQPLIFPFFLKIMIHKLIGIRDL